MVAVTRLPVDPGVTGWSAILPAAAPAVPLEGPVTADWLVIGAGFAGLAAARRITQLDPGARVVVLDAVRLGEGPAGRNSGFMIDLPHDLTSENYSGAIEADRAQIEDNRRAIGFAREMAEEFGLSAEAFSQPGKINAAARARSDRHNRDFARHLSALGEPHEMLDATQMREITGTGFYQSGLFTPGAAMIQPALFVRGVAGGLAREGVVIHELSPVLALERRGDWVAKTRGGQVTAPRVILAVNGHLNSFGHLPGRLMHVFTYASMTRALTPDEVARLGGQANWGLTPSDPMGTTVRRLSGTGGERIVVRNRFTFDPSLQVSAARIGRVALDHDRAFAARFPMLAGVGMEYRWGGRLCLSYNNVQVVRALDEGLYAACVQNGLGTVKGTHAGMLAVELACGQDTPALARALAEPEPTRLPPAPLARIGAGVRLRWSEMRAGRDL